jgi:hypothetical protein
LLLAINLIFHQAIGGEITIVIPEIKAGSENKLIFHHPLA